LRGRRSNLVIIAAIAITVLAFTLTPDRIAVPISSVGSDPLDEFAVSMSLALTLAYLITAVGFALTYDLTVDLSAKRTRQLGYQLGPITGIDPARLLAASEGDPAALAEVEAHMTKQTSSQARSNFQRPSMAQDMQKGRKTEIGELNGFIVQKAKEVGYPAPTHERLVEIVRAVERGEINPRPEVLFSL